MMERVYDAERNAVWMKAEARGEGGGDPSMRAIGIVSGVEDW